MNHIIIMAGGVGSRFWPMSTPERPKQFIDVLGTGYTLLQLTADRFEGICPVENIWVVTSVRYRELVKAQLPGIPDSNILLEPCMRNTAPCIAYAAWKIKKKDPQANLIVTAADHIVMDVPEFKRVIREGIDFVKSEDRILTIGMWPTRPETGYGYIKVKQEEDGAESGAKVIREVEGFKEKPDLKTAEAYLAAGGYYWNAGIFLWNVRTVENAFRRNEPEIAAIFDSLNDIYYSSDEQQSMQNSPNVSIFLSITPLWSMLPIFMFFPQLSDGLIWEPGGLCTNNYRKEMEEMRLSAARYVWWRVKGVSCMFRLIRKY